MKQLTGVILALLSPIQALKGMRWPREFAQTRRMANKG
jgi:hypothetical protein